jgi:lysophospholipase L1-like esterase
MFMAKVRTVTVPQIAILVPVVMVIGYSALVAFQSGETNVIIGALIAGSLLIYLVLALILKPESEVSAKWALMATTTIICFATIGLCWHYVPGIKAFVRGAKGHRPDRDLRLDGDWYADKPWASDYFQELSKVKKVWTPWVYWRRLPFEGKHINVDGDRLRMTDNGDQAEDSAVKIYAFGGSTMWGTGARDDHTIASYISKELRSKGHAVHVTNFGESNYVTTQSLITLIFELRGGDRPDIVLFYDGINDTGSAGDHSEAGLSRREIGLEKNYNRKKGFPSRWKGALAPHDKVAGQVIDVYFANIGLLDHLSQTYGFKYQCFWQPVFFVDKPPSSSEENLIGMYQDEGNSVFFVETYKALRSRTLPPHTFDLSDLFATRKETTYIDVYHLTEDGNQIVAKAMVEKLEPLVLEVIKKKAGVNAAKTDSAEGK